MTQKEKAIELVKKMTRHAYAFEKSNGKLCALIAVDEIIDVLNQYVGMFDQDAIMVDKMYYEEVKKQIELLETCKKIS